MVANPTAGAVNITVTYRLRSDDLCLLSRTASRPAAAGLRRDRDDAVAPTTGSSVTGATQASTVSSRRVNIRATSRDERGRGGSLVADAVGAGVGGSIDVGHDANAGEGAQSVGEIRLVALHEVDAVWPLSPWA